MEAKRIRLLPDTTNPAEAARALTAAGDASVVVRGVVRSLVLRCPCGCGENYIINLDPRAGPAWRHYRRKGTLTLYPSYWRHEGCGSHFIINRNEIWWCRFGAEWLTEVESAIVEKVRGAALPVGEFSPRDIAEQIDEIPWEVGIACDHLVREGIFEKLGKWPDTRYRTATR